MLTFQCLQQRQQIKKSIIGIDILNITDATTANVSKTTVGTISRSNIFDKFTITVTPEKLRQSVLTYYKRFDRETKLFKTDQENTIHLQSYAHYYYVMSVARYQQVFGEYDKFRLTKFPLSGNKDIIREFLTIHPDYIVSPFFNSESSSNFVASANWMKYESRLNGFSTALSAAKKNIIYGALLLKSLKMDDVLNYIPIPFKYVSPEEIAAEAARAAAANLPPAPTIITDTEAGNGDDSDDEEAEHSSGDDDDSDNEESDPNFNEKSKPNRKRKEADNPNAEDEKSSSSSSSPSSSSEQSSSAPSSKKQKTNEGQARKIVKGKRTDSSSSSSSDKMHMSDNQKKIPLSPNSDPDAFSTLPIRKTRGNSTIVIADIPEGTDEDADDFNYGITGDDGMDALIGQIKILRTKITENAKKIQEFKMESKKMGISAARRTLVKQTLETLNITSAEYEKEIKKLKEKKGRNATLTSGARVKYRMEGGAKGLIKDYGNAKDKGSLQTGLAKTKKEMAAAKKIRNRKAKTAAAKTNTIRAPWRVILNIGLVIPYYATLEAMLQETKKLKNFENPQKHLYSVFKYMIDNASSQQDVVTNMISIYSAVEELTKKTLRRQSNRIDPMDIEDDNNAKENSVNESQEDSYDLDDDSVYNTINIAMKQHQVDRNRQKLEKTAARKTDLKGLSDTQKLYVQCAQELRLFQTMTLKGPPGVGKSTVGYVIQQLRVGMGLDCYLNSEILIGSSLPAGYSGQSAAVMESHMDNCIGTMVFIDEFYGITGGTNKDSGVDMLTVMVGRLTSPIGLCSMLLAGYEGKMDAALKENEGLGRRIRTQFVLASPLVNDLANECTLQYWKKYIRPLFPNVNASLFRTHIKGIFNILQSQASSKDNTNINYIAKNNYGLLGIFGQTVIDQLKLIRFDMDDNDRKRIRDINRAETEKHADKIKEIETKLDAGIGTMSTEDQRNETVSKLDLIAGILSAEIHKDLFTKCKDYYEKIMAVFVLTVTSKAFAVKFTDEDFKVPINFYKQGTIAARLPNQESNPDDD